MNDSDTPLEEIKKRVLQFANDRDWEQFHSPKNLSMALAAEAGELLEHFLWTDSEESRRIIDDHKRLAKVREELADIVIYAIEFANMTGIDLAQAIEKKMALNAEKYPVEKARGSSAKYNELG